MADDKYTKILEIQLNYEKAIKGIASYELEIKKARDQQKQWQADLNELEKEFKKGNVSVQEYEYSQGKLTEKIIQSKTAIKELQYEQGVIQKQLQNQVKLENAESESLVALRAKLSNLTAEYDALSGEMRNSDVGKALEDQINAVTDQLKGAEEDTQRYYRNVGNYENSVRAALQGMNEEIKNAQETYDKAVKEQGEMSDAAEEAKQHLEGLQYVMDFTTESSNKMMASIVPFGDKIIPMLTKGMSGVKEAFHLAAQGAQILGKQFLALMANPIVAFLGILAAAITLVVNGIKGSEENMNQWNRIMAPVTRALTGLRNVVEILCGWILNVVEAGGRLLYLFGNIVEWATSGIPLIGSAIHGAMEATREAIDLEQREQKLTQDRRKAIVDEAKAQKEIAKLRNESADAANNDVETRIAANKKAMDLELQIANERKRMAQEELDIERAKAEQAGNSAADNEKLAQLEAEVIKAETDYYNQTRRLQKEQNALEKQIADERKKREDEAKKQAEDRAKTAKEAADKELAAIRAAEDAMLALVKDTAEKRRTQIINQYSREIDDLKKRLDEEKNLTAAAREAINQTIAAKQQQQAEALAELDAQISSEEIQRKQREIQLMLDAVKKGNDEEYQLKLQQIQLNLEADLAATETEIQNLEERERMKALIRAKYAAQEDQLTNERQQTLRERELQAIQNEFEERLMAAENNSYTQAEIELERRQQELDNLHQMEGESNEAFRAREIAAQKAFNNAKKNLTKTENEIEQTRLEAVKTVTGGISSAFQTLGNESKAFAKMSKVVALGQIAIDTGKAISAGVSQAQSVPYPANLVAIATTVATVMANIATAISTVKSAKFAKGGKVDRDNYATGGSVRGAGTGTSDSIPAWLSNGEFVMTAAATRLFEPTLAAMNAIGRGVVPPTVTQPVSIGGMTSDSITDSFAAAAAEIHPVVSVVDINEGQARVKAIDSLDTI